jgi:hypothetical protein
MAPNAPQSSVTIYPAPPTEKLSADFELKVAGQAVPVYQCRVSAVPFNQLFKGYQRPLDQTEIASFAYWDQSGPAQVEIVSRRPIGQDQGCANGQGAPGVVVRPLSLGIVPSVDGNRIAFTMASPGQVTVEVNGLHCALHLFANPPAPEAPDPRAPLVRYFGPGVHSPGIIMLQSNETLYVAGGAVVYGAVQAAGAQNIQILGRGVIDASRFERGKGGGCIRLTNCKGVTIDGVVLRDPDVWCCTTRACSNVTISNIKLIGLWRYNADGIDICNSQDVVIRDCFIRAFDDCIVVKGLKNEAFEDRSVRNVLAERCVIWCDWGRAMEVGAETYADEIEGVTFRDCDILRASLIAMDIQHGDRAHIRGVLFEKIRLEIDDFNPKLLIQKGPDDQYPADPEDVPPRLLVIEIVKTGWNWDAQRGTVDGVTLRDIRVTGKPFPPSRLQGADADHQVRNVSIEGLRVNGRTLASLQEAAVEIRPFVEDVQIA